MFFWNFVLSCWWHLVQHKVEGYKVGSGMGSRHPGDPWVVTCGSQPGWVVWVTGNEPPTTRTGTG